MITNTFGSRFSQIGKKGKGKNGERAQPRINITFTKPNANFPRTSHEIEFFGLSHSRDKSPNWLLLNNGGVK